MHAIYLLIINIKIMSLDDTYVELPTDLLWQLENSNTQSMVEEMTEMIRTLVQHRLMTEEKSRTYISMLQTDFNQAFNDVLSLWNIYKSREETRSGAGIIQTSIPGRLIYPMRTTEEVHRLEGIYTGAGHLLRNYTVDARGFDSRRFMYMWQEDIADGTEIVSRGLNEPYDNIAKRALSENPSKRDIVLFTIVALVRTRSKRRTSKDIRGGWLNVLTHSFKKISKFGEGANICSTEAIVCKLVAQLYGIHGELKETYINEDKPSQPHNYFQVDDYPHDNAGPILDVSGAPHLWGFIRDPRDYEIEVQRGREWLKERRAVKSSSLTDWDREFMEFSLKRFKGV